MNGTFELGTVVTTRAIVEEIEKDADFHAFINNALTLYKNQNWGDTRKDDWEENDEALKIGGRILAVYIYHGKVRKVTKRVWIITEWDRSKTTILFPSDYSG